MRERHGRDAVAVGFSTYTGTVTAASEWGAPAERKRVRAGLARQLRGALPRHPPPGLPALPARPPATAGGRCASRDCTARSESSTGRRQNAKATGSPPARPAIRRARPPRPHPRRRATRAHSRPGSSPSHPRRTRPRSNPLTHGPRRGERHVNPLCSKAAPGAASRRPRWRHRWGEVCTGFARRSRPDLLVVGSSRCGSLGRVMLGDDTRAALNGESAAIGASILPTWRSSLWTARPERPRSSRAFGRVLAVGPRTRFGLAGHANRRPPARRMEYLAVA